MCRSPLPLLLPLVLAAAITALPPPREIPSRRYNPGSFYQMRNGGHHTTVPVQRHHPVIQPASRHTTVAENFYSSARTEAHYLLEDVSRSSFGIAEHRAPQYDHEKILSSSNSEAQESREVMPLRNPSDSLLRRRDSQSRTASVHNNPSIQNSENARLPNQNHRTDSQPNFSETVGRRDTGDIVFPEAMNFTPKEDIKNCSQDWTNVCVSNVRDYPYNHIEQVLTNSAYDFRSFFTDDYVDVATRIDDGSDDSVCDSDETILYPKIGQTVNDQVLFIVNNDGNYKQGVRVEKCRKKDQSPCDPKLVVPTGYRTYCKQKYIYRKLLALQPNGDPVPDNFRLPSCCSCYISKDLASFRSLGGPKGQRQSGVTRQ